MASPTRPALLALAVASLLALPLWWRLEIAIEGQAAQVATAPPAKAQVAVSLSRSAP